MAQQTLQCFTYAQAVTPDNTANIPTYQNRPPDALWIGTAGNVVVVWNDSSTTTFGCAAGQLLPLSQVKRVNSTSTTATGILAIWQF